MKRKGKDLYRKKRRSKRVSKIELLRFYRNLLHDSKCEKQIEHYRARIRNLEDQMAIAEK